MSGIVGHFESAAGVEVTQEAYSRNRAKKVVQSSGKYQDAVLRGRCFVATTAVTGVAPGTAIGTTGAFSLYNPLSSGVYLSILKASMGLISGTIGAGVVNWLANLNPAAAATTGTAVTASNCLLSEGYAAKGRPLTTATLPVTPTLLRPFCSLTQHVVATTATNNEIIAEEVDGSIILAPGCTLTLHATAAAGSSPLVVFGCMWEELPIS